MYSSFPCKTNIFIMNDFRGILNSLPNNKIFVRSNLKAFAGNILKVVQVTICVPDRVENIVGKGENAGYQGKGENAGNQHFLTFPQCFKKVSLLGLLKSQDCLVRS